MTEQEKKNIYNAIQNLYNMDFTTWQEVLAMLYNLVADVEQKFDKLEAKFTLLLGKEVTEAIRKMHEDGTLAEIINQEIFSDLNNKIDEIKVSILNTLTTEIGRIDKEIEKVNEQLDNIIRIKNNENLQEAINRTVQAKGTLELKPKEYNITDQLIIDLSKIRINGNGAVLNFSNAPSNLECIKIIGSNINPFLNNGNYIKNLEIVGKGTEENQTAIIFDSDSIDHATAHIDLKGLNIHDFNKGIEYKNYCYLIRHYSVDIYNCNIDIHMPPNGADYGENINYYGCTFYNSSLAVKGESGIGSFHFNSCSIDYCSNGFEITNGNKCFFENGHIENVGRITGNITIRDSWLCKIQSECFDTLTNSTIKIINCHLDTELIDGVLSKGTGKVIFDGCTHNDISNIPINILNENSSVNTPKNINIYAMTGTENVNSDRYTLKNCVITKAGDQETGDFCYKISKEFGPYSNCSSSIFIQRNNKNTRCYIRLRVKSSITLNQYDMPVKLYITEKQDCINYKPVLDYRYEVTKVENAINQNEWVWVNLVTNLNPINNNGNWYEIMIDMYKCDVMSLLIDRIEVYEY